ncbi:hypothetical protein EDD17DRAFT_1573233, partial [Pisolithus thermaeus]
MSKSTLTWWCRARGTLLLSIGFIEAPPGMNVDTLKKRIFELCPHLRGGPVDADLYKIPETHQLPTDEEYENGIGALSIPDL